MIKLLEDQTTRTAGRKHMPCWNHHNMMMTADPRPGGRPCEVGLREADYKNRGLVKTAHRVMMMMTDSPQTCWLGHVCNSVQHSVHQHQHHHHVVPRRGDTSPPHYRTTRQGSHGRGRDLFLKHFHTHDPCTHDDAAFSGGGIQWQSVWIHFSLSVDFDKLFKCMETCRLLIQMSMRSCGSYVGSGSLAEW